MIKKYKTKASVYALQFTIDTSEEELEELIIGTESHYYLWSSDINEKQVADKLLVNDTLFGLSRSVNFSDYIVKFNDGKITVMNQESFEKQYKIYL